MKRVLIFEDRSDERQKLVQGLRSRLGNKYSILAPEGSGQQEKNRTYEGQLEEILRKNMNQGTLVVCDKDLSAMGPQFIGLSGSTVAAVADKLGLPLCLYARGEGEPSGEEFLRSLAPWEKRRIILEYKDEEALAEDCAVVFHSFAEIEAGYNRILKDDSETPSAILSKILEKPEVEDRIALYGSGEQGFLEDIMPFVSEDDPKVTAGELKRRMPRILGNWLYTSIMRFPGILLNQIATASYINIFPDDFAKLDIQELFSEARYRGPFDGLGKWWWRHELDFVLEKSDCQDGRELVVKSAPQARPCNDPITNQRAGYYCMVTRSPVSESNSCGGISWFPAGADLARIRKDKYNELAPWLGLY